MGSYSCVDPEVLKVNSPRTDGTVSVVVPMYNAARTIEATVGSLLALDPPAHEIIVVDDRSTDRSVEIARPFPIRLLQLAENQGAGSARMVGASVASGSYLAFTDSDVTVPTDWLARGLRVLEETGAAAVTGPFDRSVGSAFIQRFCLHYLRDREITTRARIASCTTANLLVRTDAFRDSGGFPLFGLGRRPKRPFQGHEDANWAYLFTRDEARQIVWEPSLGVTHDFRTSLRGYLRQQRDIAMFGAVSFARYPAMLRVPSNFRKQSTIRHVLTTGVCTVAGVALLPAAVLVPPAWLGVGACGGLIGLTLLDHRPFLAIAVREERSAGFLGKSLATLYLHYLAQNAGIARGLVLLALAGWQFTDIEELPPFEELGTAGSR